MTAEDQHLNVVRSDGVGDLNRYFPNNGWREAENLSTAVTKPFAPEPLLLRSPKLARANTLRIPRAFSGYRSLAVARNVLRNGASKGEVTKVRGRSNCRLAGIETGTTAGIPAIDAHEFRAVLSNFCTGLTVVTAMTDPGPVGFTCQSFSSLSVDPPLVLFCPSNTSTTWPRIREAGQFCVNILAAHHEHVSARFAKSGADKFQDIEFGLSPNGSPLLPRAVAWIDCRLHAEHEGGDHVIAVGAVHDLAATEELQPLLFHRSRYARVVEGGGHACGCAGRIAE